MDQPRKTEPGPQVGPLQAALVEPLQTVTPAAGGASSSRPGGAKWNRHSHTFDPNHLGLTVKPKWERRLASIGHASLRDHLRMLCLNAQSARADGASYLRAKHPGFAWMRKKNHRVVAVPEKPFSSV